MAVAGLVSALGLCLLSGCGGDSGDQLTAANRGDCVASVRFRGVVHITNTHVDQTAPKGRAIGPGALLNCDHRTVVDGVVVSAVRGADTRRAVSVRGDWHGVYVAEGPPSVQ